MACEKSRKVAVQGIDDEHVCRRGVGLCGFIVDDLGRVVDLLQRRGEPERTAGNFSAGPVRVELARARDRHLDENGGYGRKKGNQKDAEDPKRIVAAVAEAAEEEREVCE